MRDRYDARLMVKYPAEERRYHLARIKLYCLVTEVYQCEQLAYSYLIVTEPGVECMTAGPKV